MASAVMKAGTTWYIRARFSNTRRRCTGSSIMQIALPIHPKFTTTPRNDMYGLVLYVRSVRNTFEMNTARMMADESKMMFLM